MIRFLLTLLALLTGFVAPVASAQAAMREKAEAEVGALVSMGETEQHSKHVTVRTRALARAGLVVVEGTSAAQQATLAAPTVLPGIDRARE